MNQGKIKISGTGCALADFLYDGISFNSLSFSRFLFKEAGDGGLSPGKLVFIEELEKFSGMPYSEILRSLIGTKKYNSINVGGPSLVSLIHAAQLLCNGDFEVRYYGMAGTDFISERIFEILKKTPLNIDNYTKSYSGTTPFTHVLSDSDFDSGNGERAFINNIGAAWDYSPDFLSNSFFESDIVCFGGTALVPQIHDNLTRLLSKAKKNNCITLVNTVFDFRNEKKSPGSNWPLLESTGNYDLIDILIMDCEEALKISGGKSIKEAADFFTSSRVSSFIISNGANDLFAKSNGGLFEKTDLLRLPVSEKVKQQLLSPLAIKGDTTGCGDNFAGGIITSLAKQLKSKSKEEFDLIEALSWGVASGGFACFTTGGTYLETAPGEKLKKVLEIQQDYLNQIGFRKYSAIRKKLVLFGAGKIGRSFIGQLFSRGGYEVVFVDISKQIIDALNARGNYNVIIKSDTGEGILNIENVRGVQAGNQQQVINELAKADIVAVSVGLNGLEKVIPLLAKGLVERWKINEKSSLDIIIAENMRNADEFFHNELLKYLPENYPFDGLVGLVETSIGKMVPIMQTKYMEEDILQIFAEPYNTLIINKKGFKNPIPDIDGLAPKENMKAWVDRKLFIHNLGHSTAAYLGYFYNPDFIYIYEALSVPEVFRNVRETMLQSAELLLNKYPEEFSSTDLEEHIDDLLTRFQNKALGDTIFRVGCDLMRKLGPEDRLSGAIKTALDLSLPYDKILHALICGCQFRAKDEFGYMLKEDVEFVNRYQNDIKSILKEVCGFKEIENFHIFQEAEAIEKILKYLEI